MKATKATLLIPVENQVRGFDAKLLLAYIAAKRGFSAVIGSRQELKSRIAFFPRSIYIAKDLRSGSRHIFKIMRKLGCVIVAWDEEALTHQLPEVYYRTRLARSPRNPLPKHGYPIITNDQIGNIRLWGALDPFKKLTHTNSPSRNNICIFEHLFNAS